MARFLSSSDESDFEQKFNIKKRSKKLLTIDSEDEEVLLHSLEDGSIITVNENSKSPVKIRTQLSYETDKNFVKKTFAMGSPTKKRVGKRKNQLSILAFSQQTLRRASLCDEDMEEPYKQECPICHKLIPISTIEAHADHCADNMSSLEFLSQVQQSPDSHKKSSFSDMLDDDIFDNGCKDSWSVSSKQPSNIKSYKPNTNSYNDSWNLDNSFRTDNSSLERPSKKKRMNSPNKIPKGLKLAPYPETNQTSKTTRGFLRNSGNNPGKTVQMLLKNSTKRSTAASKYSEPSNISSFKVHPFLAKTSSLDGCRTKGGVTENVLIPDGEGGFVINEKALEENDVIKNDSDYSECDDAPSTSSGFSFPSTSLAGGFIDFHNQFKENSATRSSKKTKSKSPKKKQWRKYGNFKGKRRYRGRGRGRGK